MSSRGYFKSERVPYATIAHTIFKATNATGSLQKKIKVHTQTLLILDQITKFCNQKPFGQSLNNDSLTLITSY